MSYLPSRSEINVHGSPDELAACDHYLGKNSDEIQLELPTKGMQYQEDLMWMGDVAFNYYVESFRNYMLSDASIGDDDMASWLLNIFEFKFKHGSDAVDLVKILGIIDEVIENFQKFRVDDEIYPDLRNGYLSLRNRIAGRLAEEGRVGDHLR